MSPHFAAGPRASASLTVLLLLVAGSPACNWNGSSAAPHTVTPAEPAVASEAPPGTPEQPADEAVVEGELPPGAEATAPKPAAKAAAHGGKKTATKRKPSAAKKTSLRSTAKASTPAPTRPSATPSAPATTAPKPSPPKRVALPSTNHIRYIVGSGMQALVDKDPRIVTWLRRITPVLDRCYRGLSGSPKGTVKVSITMHENRRPSVGLKTLPPSLAGMMPCATSKLMGTRAPLFTGPEGQKHTISIRFQ